MSIILCWSFYSIEAGIFLQKQGHNKMIPKQILAMIFIIEETGVNTFII